MYMMYVFTFAVFIKFINNVPGTYFFIYFCIFEIIILLNYFFMSILVLQSSQWGRESWLLYLVCHSGVL